jgi:glyoxylase-like metal-dependent hydrolase (beta-lactamase superfamily II)
LATSDIHALPVPTAFDIGAVNAYLIEGSPLTLVDTGPHTATALVELERLLAEHSYRVEDLERLVLTHHHLDHSGLTNMFAKRSGAEVVAMKAAAPSLADFDREYALDGEFTRRLLLRHGVNERVVDALGSMAVGRLLGDRVDVTRPVDDGDVLESSSIDFQVHLRPGHSETDIVLFDPDSRTLITGDHLLAETSSNALVVRRLCAPADSPRPKPLLDYRRSFRATGDLGVDVALPGHGPPIEDVRGLIDLRFSEIEERAQKLLELLAARRRATSYELAQDLFRGIAFRQVFLTISEVLGHLDALVEEGVAAEDESGDVVMFEAL